MRDAGIEHFALDFSHEGHDSSSFALEQVVDPLHGRARAEELAEALGVVHHAAQALDLGTQHAVLHGALERDHQRVDLDRLGDEVVRPSPDGGDRRFEGAEGRHHHHRQVRAAGDDARAQLEPAHARHLDVGQDRIDLGGGEAVEGGLCRRGPRHLEPPSGEPRLEERTHVDVVVDDQHPAALRPQDPGLAVRHTHGHMYCVGPEQPTPPACMILVFGKSQPNLQSPG